MLRTAIASLVLACMAWLSATWLTRDFRVWTAEGARRLTVLENPVQAPPAVLAGPRMSGRELSTWLSGPGRVTIVEFVYTRCESICSVLGSGFKQMQRSLLAGPPDGVRLLSISFDPAYDDATRLQLYADRWSANPEVWRVATVPDSGELKRLLEAFQVVVVPNEFDGYEHNAALLVVDGHGRLIRVFDDTEIDTALAYAHRAAKHEAAG